ncbi:EbsA family protein [Streptococcus panodentis]|uniref:EbsA protein n=1 Tax=Streptococcus panodentis TaxID=1581472 RepID=A0ABS5AZ68_9STRE|nr:MULTISPECIES: EbsA family protein [Streptococcus]KXT84047.1 Pore forming protein ebsA [Streptococcus sp. DD11]MBP2621864.1 EbsA protein [Streptococcus panodentis]
MIKIFGKVRYHWQPDLSLLIIYWSLSVIPIFVGLALMYESSRVPTLVLFSFFLFMVLLGIGVHRYFTIYEDGTLRIITANPFTPIKVAISTIDKVAVTKTSITLYTDGKDKGRTFCMRKWPKKYFVNALALNEHFQGEVELLDNFIHIDYFETYYGNQSK